MENTQRYFLAVWIVAVAPHSSGVLERDDTTIAASVRVSGDAFVVGAGSAGGGECPVWGGARST